MADKKAKKETFTEALIRRRKQREIDDKKEIEERKKRGEEPSENFTIGGALRDVFGAFQDTR